MLGGVCGGLGVYFTVDPTLIRVLFVVLALASGTGLIAYLLLLIIVPIEPLQPPSSPPAS
jgi:phage shock protein C